MKFLDEQIDAYACDHTQEEPEVLKKLNRETHLKILYPQMLSGHLQGRALSMFSKMIQPRYILEIGTYTGYAAICFAEGLKEGGELHTIDINEELKDIVEQYFDEAGIAEKTHLHIGNALEIIPTLDKPWDLVFIDADKENYLNYYKLLIDKLPSGSYIIADNVLWSGKVTDPDTHTDKETTALRAYSDFVHNDPRVEHVLLPIRDGLLVSRKR